MTPSFATTIVSYVPEYYPLFGAVTVGLAEGLVILLGLICGLRHLLGTPQAEGDE